MSIARNNSRFLRFGCLLTTSLLIAACHSIETVGTNFHREYSSPLGHERMVVVFIHGILGSPDQTFRSEHAQLSWPEMLANDISIGQPVRTISLGYMSRPLERASNIHEIATRSQALC